MSLHSPALTQGQNHTHVFRRAVCLSRSNNISLCTWTRPPRALLQFRPRPQRQRNDFVVEAVVEAPTRTDFVDEPLKVSDPAFVGEGLGGRLIEPPEGEEKLQMVILGSGWGAMSIIKNLSPRDAERYEIIVVSSINHFVYTPLLPSAATGSVEERSIVEPVRRVLNGKGLFYEAECLSVDPQTKTLTCLKKYCAVCQSRKDVRHSAEDHTFQIKYDVLVMAVGACINTFNVPGVEQHCFFMKTTPDAKAARVHINKCAEHAVLPTTTPEERRRLLSFVVVGGGPSGVEVAAELHDVVAEEFTRLFPQIKDDVSIKLIHTQEHLLSTYDRQVSEYAEANFERTGVELMLHTRVLEVKANSVVVKTLEGVEEIPFNTCFWCTGVKAHPLVNQIKAALPAGTQENRTGLAVDTRLRVKGAEGSILALGDCAVVEQPHALDYALELFDEMDTDKDGVLSAAQVRKVITQAAKRYSHLREFAARLQKEHVIALCTGKMLDSNRIVGEEECGVTRDSFRAELSHIDASLRGLPATAQVARQEGEYLARILRDHPLQRAGEQEDDSLQTASMDKAEPFHYRHLGSLAYLGADRAVMDLPFTGPFGVLKGWLIGWAWRGMETFMQISLRNQWLVANDWARTKLFGRDISNL